MIEAMAVGLALELTELVGSSSGLTSKLAVAGLGLVLVVELTMKLELELVVELVLAVKVTLELTELVLF